MRLTGRTLKSGLLLGWALWLSVVTITNLLDALKALDRLDAGVSLASGNWPFLESTTAVHDTPSWINAILFGGVIAWELLGAILFWRAWVTFRRGGSPAAEPVSAAFVVSAALWVAFTIADEIVFAFEAENTHRLILVALLASLITLHIVPDGSGSARSPHVMRAS